MAATNRNYELQKKTDICGIYSYLAQEFGIF
jgi:hypothetical protein